MLCTAVSGVLDKPQPRQGQVITEVSWSSFLPGHPCSGYRASREFICVGRTAPGALWGHICSPPAKGWRCEDGAGRTFIHLMTHLGISKFLPLQEAGLRTSVALTYTTWESGPDILDFSVSWSFSKNFLNFLIAVRTQASSRRALPLLLCQEHCGVTLVHTCSDSGMDQAPWLHPAASKLLSICWELAEPHRVPQPHRPMMSSQALCHHHEWQHFQTAAHKFLALGIRGCCFERKERADTISVFWHWALHLW